MVVSNVHVRHGWGSLLEAHESLDYLAINAQGFGKSNTPVQKSLEGMSHGIVLVATLLIRLVEGYPDGVLQTRSMAESIALPVLPPVVAPL